MPRYTREGDTIEGERIFCTFKARPSYGFEEATGRQTVSIRGNPASAVVDKVWTYKEHVRAN